MTWGFKCLIAIFALLLVTGCSAAASRDATSGDVAAIDLSNLPPFDSVDAEGFFDVEILFGDHPFVTIHDGDSTDWNSFYRFAVRDNCLVIRFDERALDASLPKYGKSFIDPREGSRRGVFGRGVVVTLPEVKRIYIGSKTDVFATTLAQHRLDVDADGGTAWLRGHVDLVEVAVRNDGFVEAGRLRCQNVLMDLSGPGLVIAKPNDAARVIRSGSGRWASDW